MVSLNELKQKGAQSATFKVPVVGGNNGTLTVLDWALLPAGKLKSLLNRTYGTLGDFLEAAGAAGFTSLPMHYSNATDTIHTNDGFQWELDGENYPKASLITLDLGTYMARLQTAYSASE